MFKHLFMWSFKHPPSNVHTYLIWFEKPGFAGNVKNVDKSSCFKAESENSFEDFAVQQMGDSDNDDDIDDDANNKYDDDLS